MAEILRFLPQFVIFTVITFTLQGTVKREVAYNSTYDNRKIKQQGPASQLSESGACF